jgi:hypothetical protein
LIDVHLCLAEVAPAALVTGATVTVTVIAAETETETETEITRGTATSSPKG